MPSRLELPRPKGAPTCPDELKLQFRVRVALSTGKRSVQLSNKTENSTVHSYDFYSGVWMGAQNPHMDFRMLKGGENGTGEASLTLHLRKNDVDTFKIGVYVWDPDQKKVRHLVSGFQTVDWLMEALSSAEHPDEATQSLILKDNYSQNQALLHFCIDKGADGQSLTDLDALSLMAPCLSPSILHNNEEINKQVLEMTCGIHQLIEKCSNVSPINGGQCFVNSICFTQCMGCAINYPLLNMTYRSKRHRAPLSMLSYMGLATLHYTGMSPDALLKLSDAELMNRYIVPLCTSFTVCPKTVNYTGDETIGLSGNLDQSTEDFAMVMSAHHYASVKSTYIDKYGQGKLDAMTMEDLVRHLAALEDRGSDPNGENHPLISDDCETESGGALAIEGAIHKYHLESKERCNLERKASAPPNPNANLNADSEHDAMLGKMMWESTRDMDNLSSVPIGDFMSLARVLGRYGRLRENCARGTGSCAQMGLCIVSAKGPSFSFEKCELNGHACLAAQTITAEGVASYTIGESTSNMTMRDLPKGCPAQVTIALTTGQRKFDTIDALNVISSNMGELLKITGKIRVGEFIPASFGKDDLYKCCPFYMAGFFVGLEMDPCTPGVIPLELGRKAASIPKLTADGVRSVDAEPDDTKPVNLPMFGAPVLGLAGDKVRAFPVNLSSGLGREKALSFLRSIEERNDETYMPAAPEGVLKQLMSRWAPIQALNHGEMGKYNPETTWICSCAEAFDNADKVRAAISLKQRIARKFNAIQAEDPKSDGITMVVRGHMMSAVSQFYVPLPKQETWSLSCARSMETAVLSIATMVAGKGDSSGKYAQVGSAFRLSV